MSTRLQIIASGIAEARKALINGDLKRANTFLAQTMANVAALQAAEDEHRASAPVRLPHLKVVS